MPKFFNLRQAEMLIPEVESAIRAAIALKAEYAAAEADAQERARWITMSGGVYVDLNRVLELKTRRDESAAHFKEAIEKIHSFGCLVKDLDIGLIDFPTLFRGEEVLLCWKLGEPAIEFWHRVEEGFRGRKKIDQDFLDHHKGELPN
jgi:hypothetical protein